MKQLLNILRLSVSLPGRASHMKGRDFHFKWTGRTEMPELKGRTMLADINFKSTSLLGNKGKKKKKNGKGMLQHACFYFYPFTQKQTSKHIIKCEI